MSELEHRGHFVYRWYDATGRLLYIGCTIDVAKRMVEHRSSGAEWAPLAHRVEIEEYPTRSAGLAAEREAIRAEQPPFNSMLKRDTLDLGWNQFVVVDRRTGKARFHTSYRNKVEWFLALVPEPTRFIVFPDYAKYTSWRKTMRTAWARDRFGTRSGFAA